MRTDSNPDSAEIRERVSLFISHRRRCREHVGIAFLEIIRQIRTLDSSAYVFVEGKGKPHIDGVVNLVNVEGGELDV